MRFLFSNMLSEYQRGLAQLWFLVYWLHDRLYY